MTIKEIVQQNYNLQVTSTDLLADHGQTKIFLVEIGSKKYALKRNDIQSLKSS